MLPSFPWRSPGSPPHPGPSHQATEELPELRGVLQQAVAQLAPLLPALAHHLPLQERPQVLARHQELALRQQELGRGQLLALALPGCQTPAPQGEAEGNRAGHNTKPWEQPAGKPPDRRDRETAGFGGSPEHLRVAVLSGLLQSTWDGALRHSRHPAAQHGSQLPSLPVPQTSSRSKEIPCTRVS